MDATGFEIRTSTYFNLFFFKPLLQIKKILEKKRKELGEGPLIAKSSQTDLASVRRKSRVPSLLFFFLKRLG